MYELLLVLLTIFICLLSYPKLLHKRRNALVKKFPGPKTVPFFGNLLQFLFKSREDVTQTLIDYHNEFGDIYQIKALNAISFMTINPHIIESVLGSASKHLAKNEAYSMLRPWLGDGLLLSFGKKWASRRKILTPAFHFSILKEFVSLFDRQSGVLVERLSRHCNEKVIDIQPFIKLMTLDVVCETAMGVTINAQTDQNHEYVEAVSTVSEIISTRFAQLWQRSEFLFSVFAYDRKREFNKCVEILHNFTESVIENRRKELKDEKNNKRTTVASDDIGTKSKMSFLDVLLKSSENGKPLTNRDIRDEVDTFMFEGHDTTTSGIVFTLWLLSQHKSVQDKLFEEIVDVMGTNSKAPIEFQQLADLKYIEAVIKESLRLFPPVPIIGRHLDEDVVLNDGRVLPADTNFNLLLYIMFRHPKYYREPEKFDPSRFLGANEILNPYSFIPFSAGSRNCIGQKFALLEMKSTISKILRHYELLPMGEAPINLIELVLRPTNGIQLGLRRRTYKKVE